MQSSTKPCFCFCLRNQSLCSTGALLLIFSICSLANGQEKTLSIGEGPVNVMAISPNANLLAIDAFDFMRSEKRLVVFDLKSEKIVKEFYDASNDTFQGLVFTEDNKSVVAASHRKIDDDMYSVIKFWGLQSGKVDKELLLHGYAMVLGQRYLVTRVWPNTKALKVYEAKAVKIHDLETGKQVADIAIESRFAKAAISKDGKYVAVVEDAGPVKVWALPSGKMAFTLKFRQHAVNRIMFPENGTALAVTTLATYYFDLATGKSSLGDCFFPAKAISTDGTMMATRGKLIHFTDKKVIEHPDGVHVLSTRKNAVIATFRVDSNWQVRQVQFSPDRRILLVGGGDGIVRIWNISNLQP